MLFNFKEFKTQHFVRFVQFIQFVQLIIAKLKNIFYSLKFIVSFILTFFLGVNIIMAEEIKQPVAKKIEKKLIKHGHERIDNYYWLNNKNDPLVKKYISDENAYFDKKMSHTNKFQEKIFNEIKSRIKETDMSVPYRKRNYFYYKRYEDGKEYPIYCRKKINSNKEEIILDVNVLAKGHKYYNVTNLGISFDEKLLSFSVDTKGDRIYDILFKDLEKDKLLDDKLEKVEGEMLWGNDNKTIFYTALDKKTLRSYKVFKHMLFQPQEKDKLIYTEKDDTFDLGLCKSKSDKYLFIISYQRESTEYRFLNANKPDGEFEILAERENKHEYFIDHVNDKFYIKTNYNAKNFKLMIADENNYKKNKWQDLFPYDPKVLLENFAVFNKFLVLQERHKGLEKFRVVDLKTKNQHFIDFSEPTYAINILENEEPDTNLFRFSFTSFSIPNSVYDYNVDTKEKTLLKQKEILGGYDSSKYKSERLYVSTKDGKEVPISLVYRADLRDKKNGNPLLLYGYGSYGFTIDPSCSYSRISLLDRGFVFAIAHIRGGEDLGRDWYEDGKLLKKKNTFEDFVACAEFLIKNKYTKKEKLFAWGDSAGGLLMGAIANMRSDLFKGIIANVPFVDVLTTMSDPTIPLTTGEYHEWGNPDEKKYYDYILSYSPYDNIKAKNYSNILIVTSINDTNVPYWEPLKWVAKLREYKKGDNKLLFKMYLDFGHGGASGRFEFYKEVALMYAFIFDLMNIKG